MQATSSVPKRGRFYYTILSDFVNLAEHNFDHILTNPLYDPVGLAGNAGISRNGRAVFGRPAPTIHLTGPIIPDRQNALHPHRIPFLTVPALKIGLTSIVVRIGLVIPATLNFFRPL